MCWFNPIFAKLSTTPKQHLCPSSDICNCPWVKSSLKLTLQHWEAAVATQTHLVPEDEPHDGGHQDDEEDEGQEHGILRAERVGWERVDGMG